jgi:VWFA-related protein
MTTPQRRGGKGVQMSVRSVCVVLLALAAGASAQEQPELVLKSTTRLVQVSAIVHTKKGEPVTDLKQEDFQIFDNGKPQKISFFQEESNAILPGPADTQKLPPNTFTNRLEQKSGVPASVTVILLDALNTRITDQQYAKQQVIKFLQTIEPEDHVGIYTLGASLRMLHDYTTDSKQLLQQLAAYNGKVLPSATSLGPDTEPDSLELNNWIGMRGMGGAERDFYTINRVRGTLRALEFIADHLSAIPGRKNLIWVSGGFPLLIGFDNPAAYKDASRDLLTFTPEMDRTIRALNDANVAVYPVDARGLMVDPAFSAQRSAPPNQRPSLTTLHAPIGSRNQETMEELSSRTGGRAYYNTNDLKNAIRDAVSDARVTYSIGFYPEHENYDGKFHKLTLKVDRGDINVRYRKGYLDMAQSPQDDRARKSELHDAVWSPLEASAVPLIAQLKPTGPGAWEVYVRVDRRGVSLEPNHDRWQGKLDVLFVQKNEQGREFDGVDNTITLNALKPTYDRIVSEGIVFHQSVQQNTQASLLRIVVRDAASGNIGTVTVPFQQLTR